MIEQGFNCTDSTIKEMTDLFQTRVENIEPKEDKKTSSVAAKKSLKKTKKKKREDSDFSVIESSKVSTEARRPRENIVFCTENAVILQTVARIYMLSSTSTSKNRKRKISGIMERVTRS